jgi:hypothetical protein
LVVVVQLNQDFMRTCTSFDSGGDYDVSEIETVSETFRGMEEALQTMVDGMQARVKALQDKQRATVDTFGEEFSKSLDACVEVRWRVVLWGGFAQLLPVSVGTARCLLTASDALCAWRVSVLVSVVTGAGAEHAGGSGQEVRRAASHRPGGHPLRDRVV